jgi:hypothetical protein
MPVTAGEETENRFESSRRSHRMSEGALDRVHGHRRPPRAQDPPEGRRLDRIVEGSGRAVGAHEIDVGAVDARLGQGRPHGPLDAAPVRVRRRDMGGIAGAAVAEQRAESPRARLPLALKEHQRCPLPQEKAAPPPVEWPHPIARERAEAVEATHDEAAEDVVATGDHGVGFSPAQHLRSHAEGRRSRRAGRGDGHHGAARPEPARQTVAGRVVQGVGEVPRRAAKSALSFFHSPQRRPHHHGQSLRCDIERPRSRLDAQIVGGGDEEPGGAAIGHPPPVDGADELLDLSALADAQVRHGEALDLRDAIRSGEECGPEGVEILADRRHHAGGGNGDALRGGQREAPTRRRS